MKTTGLALTRPAAVLEYQSFSRTRHSIAGVDLPEGAGEVRYDAAGEAIVLHFAPGRFLVPAPSTVLAQQLTALKGAIFDVSGKWDLICIRSASGERALSAGLDETQILADRQCASIHLFDCPSIITRQDSHVAVWVHTSFSIQLLDVLAGIVPEASGD